MAYRNYATANGFIVDGTGNGDFTTLTAAMTAATSGKTIFMKPGTYVVSGSVALKAGVNIAAWEADALTPNVVIQAANNTDLFTASFAGTCSLNGVSVRTNGTGRILALSGASATIVNFNNCNLNCSSATGLSFTSSSASARINAYFCTGNIGTTGISLFAHSSSGNMYFKGCNITNTGSSTTASTCSAGRIDIDDCQMDVAITTSGSASMRFQNVVSNLAGTNTTVLTCGGSGASSITYCRFLSGTASAVSIGSGLTVTDSQLISSNTNIVTGAGSIDLNHISNGASLTGVVNPTTKTYGINDFGHYRSLGQPSATAYITADVGNVTGDGTNYTVIFNSVASPGFDVRSGFNTGTGTFTAPVAGKYLVCLSCTMYNLTASHNAAQTRIIQGGGTSATWYTVFSPGAMRDSANRTTFTQSIVLNLAANDTVNGQINVSGSTKTVGIYGTVTQGTYMSVHQLS